MLFTAAFTLGLLAASLNSGTPQPEAARIYTAPTVGLASASIATAQTGEVVKAAKAKADEEFLIEGDTLDKTLRGSLRDAFKAFEDGDFVEAERLISPLAMREYLLVQQQQLVEVGLVKMLEGGNMYLPLNRTSNYVANVWDAKSETPESASRAMASSLGYALPTARLGAAASKLYLLKALAQAQQGKNADAKKSYKRAIRLHKNNVDARIEYALLSLREGDLKTSAKQLAKLDQIFAKKCFNNRCRYAPGSKKRYSQVKFAYTNMAAASTQEKQSLSVPAENATSQ